MHTYLVHRPAIAADAAGLDAALTRLRWFEAAPHALPVRWLQSYALGEPGQRFGLVCLCQADSAAALQRHAAQTRLPAREILPVATTLHVREFAQSRVYLVRRRAAWHDDAALQRSAAACHAVVQAMAPELSWLCSHAVQERDGRLGSVCLYQAVGPAALREHARRCALPADAIVPVLGRVVFATR